jgi:hypothetical protein
MLRVPLFFTIALLVILGAYEGARELDGRAKLGALDPPLAKTSANYVVRLKFPPERFHLTRMQDAGRLIEVRSTAVYMMDVSPDAITGIAREYWVQGIDRWAGR